MDPLVSFEECFGDLTPYLPDGGGRTIILMELSYVLYNTGHLLDVDGKIWCMSMIRGIKSMKLVEDIPIDDARKCLHSCQLAVDMYESPDEDIQQKYDEMAIEGMLLSEAMYYLKQVISGSNV